MREWAAIEKLRHALPIAELRLVGNGDGLAASRFTACIPARDEETYVDACLLALDRELEAGDGMVLVANDCRDRTVERAVAALERTSRPWLVLECRWNEGKGSAPLARRLAMDVAAVVSAPDGALFSTDADTLVLPGLRKAYACEFSAGFALVCGRIGFLAAEAAILPPTHPANEAAIREYRETSRRIASLVGPDPDNPWPNHGNIGGANFAISAEAYRMAGPLPTPPFGEDRALRRRCEALALRIRYSDVPRVETSCRLDGRARGGLADELRRDRFEVDPVVDELLEPPETLFLRCHGRLLYTQADGPGEREALLRSLGLPQEAARRLASAGDRAAWQEAEDLSPRLRRERLRLSDLHRHLPTLREVLLRASGEGRSGSPNGGDARSR